MQDKETKWMHFVRINLTGKTLSFELYTKDRTHILGHIVWSRELKQYAFRPKENTRKTMFEKEILGDIADFLTELMEEKKRKKQLTNKHKI